MKRLVFLQTMLLSLTFLVNGQGEGFLQPSANLAGYFDVEIDVHLPLDKRLTVNAYVNTREIMDKSGFPDELGMIISADFLIFGNFYASAGFKDNFKVVDVRDLRGSFDMGFGYRKASDGNRFYILPIVKKGLETAPTKEISLVRRKAWYYGIEGEALFGIGRKTKLGLNSEINSYPKAELEIKYMRKLGNQTLFLGLEGNYYFSDYNDLDYGMISSKNFRIDLGFGIKIPF